MIELLERLNVRAEERRVAICIFFGFFIALNGLWAWRLYAGDTEWAEKKAEIKKAKAKSKKFKLALDDLKSKEAEWKAYQESVGASQGGGSAWTDLHTRVRNLARANKLEIRRSTPSEIDDSEFPSFTKKTVNMDFTGADNSLISYLVALAKEPQMVRVSSLSIRRPSNDPQKLTGNISVVASFPKKEKEKKDSTDKDKKS
tara:strand:+ start:292 stop:894 length:603 start_codon:yes stop_codon:yes gene_type:complete